jgi:general secretion pathway protein K
MQKYHPRTNSQQNRSGAALLAVLWVIALLILLVGSVTMLLTPDIEMSGTKRQILRARLLAESGLALAMHPDVRPDDPILFREFGPGEGYRVTIVGEDGRLNPNILLQRQDRDTLRRVFRAWGLDILQQDALINYLIDWVDPDNAVQNPGAEQRAYGRKDMPFNRPFRSIEEMSLVKGMRDVEQLYPNWRDWFSVYASGVLDVNEAAPEVLSAVTGADVMLCERLRARRLGKDGIPNTKDDAPLPDLQTALNLLGVTSSSLQDLSGILSVTSSTRRIVCTAQSGDTTRELGVVIQGAPGQGGGGEMLWLGEK